MKHIPPIMPAARDMYVSGFVIPPLMFPIPKVNPPKANMLSIKEQISNLFTSVSSTSSKNIKANIKAKAKIQSVTMKIIRQPTVSTNPQTEDDYYEIIFKAYTNGYITVYKL